MSSVEDVPFVAGRDAAVVGSEASHPGQIMGERLTSQTDQRELGMLMAGITDTGHVEIPKAAGAMRVDNPGKRG